MRHLKDHWYIAIALLAIFVTGNGFGYVFGAKTSHPAQEITTVATSAWAGATLDKLQTALDLSPEQRVAIRSKVDATAAKVIAARERTLFDYHVLLLTLHDELENDLDPAQQERLQQAKSSLEETIRSRFSDLPQPAS